MAYLGRHPLFLKASEELWDNLKRSSNLSPRQDSTGACAGNPCGSSSTCDIIDSPVGAYMCCVKGAGATSCSATCPGPYRSCSRSCCLGACAGSPPFAECASSSVPQVTSDVVIIAPSGTQVEESSIGVPSASFVDSPSTTTQPPAPAPTTSSAIPSRITTPVLATSSARVPDSSSSTTRPSTTRPFTRTSASTTSRTEPIALETSSSRTSDTTISTSSTLGSTPTSLGNTGGSEGSGGLGFSEKVAIGVTIPLVFILGVMALLWFLRKRRKDKDATTLGPELHGVSKANELAGHRVPSLHEIGAEEDKEIGYIAPVIEEKNEANSNVIATPRREIQELPSHETGATLSGPPTFEMSDSAGIGAGTIAMSDRSEMSASPISGRGEPTRPNPHARELSGVSTIASVNRPISPIQRKELPATPLVIPGVVGGGSQYPLASPQESVDEVERERQVLEQRRAKIAAEREHLRRMRELDEEESHIEQRLSTLGRPKQE